MRNERQELVGARGFWYCVDNQLEIGEKVFGGAVRGFWGSRELCERGGGGVGGYTG